MLKADDKFWVDCPNCGEARSYKRKVSARKAERLSTICKSCSAQRNIERYNGTVKEEHGIRLSWFRTYKVGAKARGLVFNITAKDVADLYQEQQGLCAMSGQPISLPESSKYKLITASIDRVDNTRGYTKDNIQLVHKKVNMLRGAMPIEDFLDLCKQIAEYN